MNTKAWKISVAASILLVVGVIATLFGSGYRFFVVATPSMGTVAPVGTLVAVHPEAAYHIGDIVTYERKNRSYTHRIVDITDQGFITKGDINGATDALPVKPSEIVGLVSFHARYLGFLLQGLPWIILGCATVYGITLLPRVRKSWRWQIRFVGWSLVLSAVMLWIRPWVNLVMMGYAPSGDGVAMHLVSTGIFPFKVLGTVFQSGQDAVVQQNVADSSGHYTVTPQLALTPGWFLLLLAICLTPMLASLLIRVEDPTPAEVTEAPIRWSPAQTRRGVAWISVIVTSCIVLVALVLQWSTQAAFAASITNSTNKVSTRTYFTCQNAETGTTDVRFAWSLSSAGNQADLVTAAPDFPGTISGTAPTAIDTSAPACPRDASLKALDFTGATCVTQLSSVPSPNAYSIEVWFKTGTKANGKLIGFGNATDASDGYYDRHLYIDSTGHLIFGTFMRSDNTQHVIVTSKSVADDKWHHAIATSTAAGALAFYVDGALVGTSTIANQDDYTGYWKVGCGNLNTWQDSTTTWLSGWPNYYTGQLRFAAVYTTALTAAQALEHYQAGI